MSLGESWGVSGGEVDLTGGALIGVLNVTPDSFSDGGLFFDADAAIAHGLDLVRSGAAMVDVGGESTRPGATPITEDVELGRVRPVVEALAAEGVVVSIDTYKPLVAEASLRAGAQILNDITGFTSPAMIDVASASNCGVIVMHMQGTPETMSVNPHYDDVVTEVEDFLLTATDRLRTAGIDSQRIAIDPGFGFGKRAHHSLALLAATDRLARHGYPMVVGASRKGFLATNTSCKEVDLDLITAITTALAYEKGARLFRVHDVSGSRQALDLVTAIEGRGFERGDPGR